MLIWGRQHRIHFYNLNSLSNFYNWKNLKHTDTLLDDADYNPALDGESGEILLNYTDVDQQVHVSDPKKPDTRHDSHAIKEIKEPIVKDQSGLGLSHTEDSLGLGIDWDAGHQTRFVKWVTAEKRRRQDEKGMLTSHWKRLAEERKKFELEKKDLEIVEAEFAQKLSQVKDLIPVA